MAGQASIDWDGLYRDGDYRMCDAEDVEEEAYWEGLHEFTVDDVDVVESGGTYQRTRQPNRNAECREALIMIVCCSCVLCVN